MSAIELTQNECITVLRAALQTEDWKILNYQLLSNIPDGFNGLYFTLIIDYQQDNEEKQLSCFLKSVPRNKQHFKFIDGTKLLMKEYEIYETIFPTFKQHINYKLPVPNCYLVRYVKEDQFQNIMVMENLKEKGFIMRNPREVMGYTECLLVIRALAKLHAGSVIFNMRSKQPLLELCHYSQEALWVTDPNNPTFPWVQSAIDTITELTYKLDNFSSRLESPESKKMHDKAWADTVKSTQPSNKYENVICHGDIWSNNIMFKYEDNECTDVMIIDFQVYRIVPPILDVLMFIYLNTTRDFRTKYKDKLICEYAKALKEIIENCECVLPQGLTLEGLREQEKEFTLFALVTATGYVPMGQLPPEARITKDNEKRTEGARDFDVLYDFLNSRSEQVWRGMQMDSNFSQRIIEAIDELLTYIGL